MINARLFVGDVVYIRQQDTVENGEIAFVLKPENPMYRSRIFYYRDNEARIIGRAVGATVMIT